MSSFENSDATRKFLTLILNCDLLIWKIYFKQLKQLKEIITKLQKIIKLKNQFQNFFKVSFIPLI